jgi:hypothetical protein
LPSYLINPILDKFIYMICYDHNDNKLKDCQRRFLEDFPKKPRSPQYGRY